MTMHKILMEMVSLRIVKDIDCVTWPNTDPSEPQEGEEKTENSHPNCPENCNREPGKLGKE